MGGRPRTPTSILELRGGLKNRPQRREKREREPIVSQPLGGCPEDFTDKQRRAWADITTQAPAGVLTMADTAAVENAARLLAKERDGVNSDSGGRRLDQLLGKFGMTPSDRSKVSVSIPAPRDGNPFGLIH